jgi:urease accessory protein
VELGHGAAFVAAETIGPGRRARGERFDYELLEVRIGVLRDGRELCADCLRLEPDRAPPDRPGVLGEADYLVSLLAVAPERDASVLAAAIDRALAAEVAFRGAAGELPRGAGAIARILAPSAPLAERALRCAWGAARAVLLGAPLPERRK